MDDPNKPKQPDAPWEFKAGETISASPVEYQTQQPLDGPSSGSEITWTASEFIRHDKSTDWYLALAVIDILIAGVVYLIFRDLVTAIVVVVAGLGLGFYGNLKPKQQAYTLDMDGLTVGQRFYGYNEFRSFWVVDEGAFTSIQFTPLKRFGTPINIYFDPNDEDAILQLLSTHLPMEEAKHDAVDNIIKRIRF